MARYRVVFQDKGNQAVEPQESYRGALNIARTVAWRTLRVVVVENADSGEAQMIVHPDGRTEQPREGRR